MTAVDGEVPEHWKELPEPPVDDSVPVIEFPVYDLGKVGGYKTADRPYLLAIASFEALHPGLLSQVLMVEAHLERNGPTAHPSRRASWLKWIALITNDLRQWGALSDRKIEIARDIVQQVTESYAEAKEKIDAGRYFARGPGLNRMQSYGVVCPRCDRHVSARDFYEHDPDLGFRFDAPLRTRLFRHKAPSGEWCFDTQTLTVDPASLVKVT